MTHELSGMIVIQGVYLKQNKMYFLTAVCFIIPLLV